MKHQDLTLVTYNALKKPMTDVVIVNKKNDQIGLDAVALVEGMFCKGECSFCDAVFNRIQSRTLIIRR